MYKNVDWSTVTAKQKNKTRIKLKVNHLTRKAEGIN